MWKTSLPAALKADHGWQPQDHQWHFRLGVRRRVLLPRWFPLESRQPPDRLLADRCREHEGLPDDQQYRFDLSVAVPVEYPIAGDAPSPFKIGVVDIASAKTNWMKVPNDKVLQSYITRMEWAGNNELIMQHMNRRQNESNILLCDVKIRQFQKYLQ